MRNPLFRFFVSTNTMKKTVLFVVLLLTGSLAANSQSLQAVAPYTSLSGPAKLPPDIAEKLNREVEKAVAAPEAQARFRRDGFITQPMGVAAFTKFVADEGARWKPLIERAGLAGKGG